MIVGAGAHVAIHRPFGDAPPGDTGRGRKPSGRLTKRSPGAVSDAPDRWGYVYLVCAFLAVLVPSVLFGTLTQDSSDRAKWILGYVIYGLIAAFWVAIPSAWAYWGKSDAPFTTLFVTLANLERKSHIVLLVVLAGLAILLVHLALYPWPDIADILQRKPRVREPTAP